MLKIGEFSVLSQISIHMLRHYDEIGLLIPEHVDDFTGYRYYSECQLPIANKIQALKSMGLGLTLQFGGIFFPILLKMYPIDWTV